MPLFGRSSSYPISRLFVSPLFSITPGASSISPFAARVPLPVGCELAARATARLDSLSSRPAAEGSEVNRSGEQTNHRRTDGRRRADDMAIEMR